MMADSLPLDQTFAPPLDASGTRLWNETLSEPVGVGLAGNVTCMSCHTTHGAVGGDSTLTSMAENDPDSTRAPLCENCHG